MTAAVSERELNTGHKGLQAIEGMWSAIAGTGNPDCDFCWGRTPDGTLFAASPELGERYCRYVDARRYDAGMRESVSSATSLRVSGYPFTLYARESDVFTVGTPSGRGGELVFRVRRFRVSQPCRPQSRIAPLGITIEGHILPEEHYDVVWWFPTVFDFYDKLFWNTNSKPTRHINFFVVHAEPTSPPTREEVVSLVNELAYTKRTSIARKPHTLAIPSANG